MSRPLGSELPEPIRKRLAGDDLSSHWGETLQLATVDANGFPHFAILTYGEIVCTGPSQLRIGMYPNSSTSRNMRERAKVSLLFTAGEAIYYVKGSAAEGQSRSEATARFDVSIDTVLVDDEPGARITSGLTFELASGKDAWLETAQKTLAALQ